MEKDGSLVYPTRIKRIRIDQNNVASLYDFAVGDGTREIEYEPGKDVGQFLAEGRWCSLIALGRVYYRGEHLNFTVKRIARDAFTKPHDAVSVLTRDATAQMRLTIKWPADRPPTALRLGQATPSQDWRNENVIRAIKTEDDRSTYTVEIPNPEKGGSTVIEWEW